VTTGARVPVSVVLVTAGPVCVVLALLLAFVLGELAGYSPLRYDPPANIVEAAAQATASDLLRRLRIGEDPNTLVSIRPEVISSAVTRVSAVEAAIWGRTVELVRLLDREGAIATEERRRYLACLSEALQAQDIREYLAPHGTTGCDGEQMMQAIQSRAR
jgi:hypothetical protein